MDVNQLAIAVSTFYQIAAVVNVLALGVVFHRLGYGKVVTALPLVSAVALTALIAGWDAARWGVPWFEWPGRQFLQASLFCVPVFLVVLAATAGRRARSVPNA